MRCYLCHWICDFDACGLCVNCRELLARNNYRVYLLSLLKDVLDEARGVLSIRTIEKLEAELERKPPFVKQEVRFAIKKENDYVEKCS